MDDMYKRIKTYTLLLLVFLGLPTLFAQEIPSPKEHFGFNIGDDHMLANYSQAEAYFKKLASISDRVQLRDIGQTEEGRTMYAMVISSPENLKDLDRYKEISQKMARAEDLTDEQAKRLAKEGKPIVWIDGGLHATETVGSHQLIETYYQLLSNKDEETLRILDDVIILLVQVNPDGQELVADWYMRNEKPEDRKTNIPRLYQKYIGHDNNRDFYMMNMKETTNISREQYIEWMPQIIYNHHQSSPAGAVVAGPPYRDPFNFVYDPMVITGIDQVGAAMINRLNLEGKPGYTRLDGSVYSTWWNGGLRTTPYFHNMIGILTEIWGSPGPDEIPFVPERLIPDNATPYPVLPQTWKFRNSIDYSVSLNYAVLDYASRNGDQLLYRIYKMGKNNIEKGNRDHWSLQPNKIEGIRTNYEKDVKEGREEKPKSGRRSNQLPVKYYDSVFKDPDLRDARGYILSAGQNDFPTAVKFVNALIKSGISVQRATADFSVNGKQYPKNSYILKTNQAFRPHLMDMISPQDHPNDFLYPGGPPVRPYDAAGWTLAYQMGVEFDRVLDDFQGPFEKLPYGELQEPPTMELATSRSGYILSPKVNNSFIVVNDLLKAGKDVYRLTKEMGEYAEGSFYVPLAGSEILKKSSAAFGVGAASVAQRPNDLIEIKPKRIALFDRYGGSMPSGWVRWIFEQFHYTADLIYPQDVDKGNLNSKYDVILFIGSGIPEPGQNSSQWQREEDGPNDIPKEFRGWMGRITAEKSIPKLKEFMEKGGEIVTVGSSTALAFHLDLPLENALMKLDRDGKKAELSGTEYYIPGSLLKATLDVDRAVNWGMPPEVDMVFNRSPVFRLDVDAASKGVVPLAWFAGEDVLRSGWAWGKSYLNNGVAAFEAKVGKGKLYAFGPEITFRAQSHGTFKMLFNTLYAK